MYPTVKFLQSVFENLFEDRIMSNFLTLKRENTGGPQGVLTDCMENVCVSFGNLLSSVPGNPMDLPGVMDTLGLTRTLAWKVLRLSRGEDVLAAAEHLPGQDGIAIVLRAASSAGARQADIEAVRQSTDRLYSMVGEHASSLPELRRLIQGLGANRHERTDLLQRRAAMEANSQIWGVRAAVEYRADIVIDRDTSSTCDRCDRAFIKGFVDLVRANEDSRFEFLRTYNARSMSDSEPYPTDSLSIFPEQESEGVSFIRASSSNPLPPVSRRTWADSSESFDLLPGSVGKSGATTVMLGQMMPSFVYRRATARVPAFHQMIRLVTPVELVCVELIVQRSIYQEFTPTVRLYDMMRAHLPIANEYNIEPPRMNTDVRITAMGSADKVPPILEVPGHAEMLRSVYERLGCRPEDFDVWQVRLRYPPLPTTMICGFELPK